MAKRTVTANAYKLPIETNIYEIEWSGDLATSDTLSGNPTVTEVGTSVFTVSGQTTSGTKSQWRLDAAGVAGTKYEFLVSQSTTNSDIHAVKFFLVVE